MVDKKAQKKKILKWVVGAILVVAVLIVGTSWYISAKLKPIIKEELKSLVLKSTNGLYHLEFSDLHTNLLFGSAKILNVTIIPDSNVYKKLILEKNAPNNLYNVKLKQIAIKRFHPFNIYLNKKIEVDLVLFDDAEVRMVNRHFDFNEDNPPRPRKSPYEFIKGLFRSIQVKTIDFRNINFKYVNNNRALPEVDSISQLNVTLTDWLIDSLSAQDKSRLYLLKDVHVNVNNYSFATPDSMYHIKVKQLDFRASTKKVNIKQFALLPRYSETNFPKVNGYARDRFNILMNDISFSGLNLPAYLQKQELIASEIAIKDGNVSVFNNNEYIKLSKDKTGKFPHQLLQKLDAKITVQKINLTNVDVSYAEFDRDSKQRGVINFDKTSGTITNVTNVKKAKVKNAIMQADLLTYVMKQGKLAVQFKFFLESPKGAFDYKGNMSNLDGRQLNKITKPLGMLQINRGDIKDFAFEIKANSDVAKGKLDFKFNDLSVGILEKEDGRQRLVKRGLVSLLANALVIYSDNPNNKGNFTSAPINYDRAKTASFFSFIWRTLFQGVKYSVGFTPKKEAEINAQIAKFEKMKADRDDRRKRRQIRIDKRERQR